MHASTRPAAVAGRFYSDQPAVLAAQLDAWLSEPPPAGPAPKLILVPHAGYIYSGEIAARAYVRLPREGIERVVLLGPTHRVAVRGLALPRSSAFETPLGRVPIDAEARVALADLPQVVEDEHAHAQEHALEVQLPFLQRRLGAFRLVPLAVGQAAPAEVAEVLERLWGGDETLIVISSDLSHYLPYAQAQAKDRATVERLQRLEAPRDHEEACGATPLAGALLSARRHGLRAELLDLRNSGDTAGDRSRVVGYAAIVFSAAPPTLGAVLLARARAVIARELGLPCAAVPDHPALLQPGACFVTLHRNGQLRGCIGSLEATRALGADLDAHAHAAAFADPRFPPLRQAECDADLRVEVSLLSEPELMDWRSELEACAALRPDSDGLVMRWRGHRATFLPQVWQQLREPQAFVRALRRKAGLAEDFWADDLHCARYTVQCWSD